MGESRCLGISQIRQERNMKELMSDQIDPITLLATQVVDLRGQVEGEVRAAMINELVMQCERMVNGEIVRSMNVSQVADFDSFLDGEDADAAAVIGWFHANGVDYQAATARGLARFRQSWGLET